MFVLYKQTTADYARISYCSADVCSSDLSHTADIASLIVQAVDVITVREKAKKQCRIRESLDLASSIGIPQWVEVDASKMAGTFKSMPDRADVARDVNDSMVVELYSR